MAARNDELTKINIKLLPMFIKQNYSIRHKLLGVLFDHEKKQENHGDIKSRSIHFSQICQQLPQYEKTLLLDNLDFLRTSEEIYCSMQFDNSSFAILSRGSHVYRENRYLREGVKDQLNYIYDFAKTFSVIVLLFIAVWTFFQNINQTRKNVNDIALLRKEVKDLNDQIILQTDKAIQSSKEKSVNDIELLRKEVKALSDKLILQSDKTIQSRKDK